MPNLISTERGQGLNGRCADVEEIESLCADLVAAGFIESVTLH